LSNEIKRNYNVSLLILGILILITGVATSTVFSASLAYADSGDSKDKQKAKELEEKVKQALEKAKQAFQNQKRAGEKVKEDRAKAQQLAKEEAEKKALEEQKAKEQKARAEEWARQAEAARSYNSGSAGTTNTAKEDSSDNSGNTIDTASTENQNTSEDSSDNSGNTIDTASTENQNTSEDSSDNSGNTIDTASTETSSEVTNSETSDVGQTTPSNDLDVLAVIADPVQVSVESVGEMTIAVDHIDDSPDGKMVYINGQGARESAKIAITIFGDNNDEIVELGIYATNNGEFSTVWIAGKDMNIDGTYVIKATDNQNAAQTTVKLNGQPVEVVTETTTTQDSTTESQDSTVVPNVIETTNTLPGDSIDPNAGVEEKVSALQSLVNAMQSIIDSLTASLNSFQAQLDEESKARQEADKAIDGKLNEISSISPKLVAYERAMYITMASGEQSSHTITCPDGDIAQTGGVDIKSEEVTNFKTFANHMDGTNGWYVQAANNNPSDSVEMKLFVNCLKVDSSQSISAQN